MSENMQKVKLEDVAEILDSRRIPITASARVKGSYPYYGANGIQDYVNRYIFDDELVLLAEDGGNFGSETKPIAYRVSGKCWVNNHAHVLKAKSCIDIDYLCYSLMFYDVSSLVNGATRQKLTQKDMRNMIILLRDREEQIYIVKLLNSIISIIEKRNKQLEKLDELIKSKFTEMFGEHSNSLQSWNISTLGEQFEVCSGGTPSTSESKYWENGTIPWIGSNMCQNEILLINDGKFITNEGLAHSAAKWVYKGAVLVALVGATIGKTALIKFDTATNQNIASINVPANNNFRSEFIFYQLQMQYHKFMEIGNGKFKMANLSFVRALPCVCPPIELQNQFTDFVEKVESIKIKVKQSLTQVEVLKKSLMQKYFG